MAPHKYNAEEVIAAFKKPTQRKISEEPEGSKHLDINQVRRALTYLDPSNRKVWINVGHEMKSEGEILCELYLEWSRGDLTGTTPNSFVSDEEVYSKWEEFDPKRTSISFLFRAAEKNGYEPPHDSYLLERGTIVECAEHLLSKMFLKGEEHLTFQPCATLLMISGLRILIPCVNGMPKAKSDVTLVMPKLLKELYKNFCDDILEFEDANYLPGKRRFIAQIKTLVETDVDWRIERHGRGVMICRNTLV